MSSPEALGVLLSEAHFLTVTNEIISTFWLAKLVSGDAEGKISGKEGTG